MEIHLWKKMKNHHCKYKTYVYIYRNFSTHTYFAQLNKKLFSFEWKYYTTTGRYPYYVIIKYSSFDLGLM